MEGEWTWPLDVGLPDWGVIYLRKGSAGRAESLALYLAKLSGRYLHLENNA